MQYLPIYFPTDQTRMPTRVIGVVLDDFRLIIPDSNPKVTFSDLPSGLAYLGMGTDPIPAASNTFLNAVDVTRGLICHQSSGETPSIL